MTYCPDICIYHSPCADGFTAAWAVWKKWDGVVFHEGVYGKAPPDVTGLHVLLVDFSYKRPVLEQMAQSAASITILDHHKSAKADLESWSIDAFSYLESRAWLQGQNIRAWFDMEKSGARMAWEFCFPGERIPKLVLHVEDRDLWKFELPGTREIQACVFSHQYTFSNWNTLAANCDDLQKWTELFAQGSAIERKHHKDVGELVLETCRSMLIGGHRVLVANLPYTMASDAAGMLALRAPFGACYFDRADGRRIFSLRSRGEDGADVSEIAKRYGGGGHRNAAGFQAPLGWEGDDVKAIEFKQLPWS